MESESNITAAGGRDTDLLTIPPGAFEYTRSPSERVMAQAGEAREERVRVY